MSTLPPRRRPSARTSPPTCTPTRSRACGRSPQPATASASPATSRLRSRRSSTTSDAPIDVVASSASWAVEKPSPAFFARIVAETGLDASEIAYVGDRVDNDVVPAADAGMVAVHLRRGPWGHLQADWPEVGRAAIRIEGLDELVPALARL